MIIQVPRAGFASLLSLFLVVSCSAEPTPAGPGQGDSGSGCTGCIDLNGECLSGDLQLACGGNGSICQSCQAPTVCAEGQCLTPPSCNSENCVGCCTVDGSCIAVDFQSSSQCGVNGGECTNCGSGACSAGTCEELCGPTTCSGCCDGDECVEIGNAQNATSCGKQGAACQACGGNATCTGGSCVDTSCNLDCPDGCCDGATCRGGRADQLCGNGGESCFACGAPGDSQTCGSAGACEVDPNSRWDFYVVNAGAHTQDANGGDWDPFGGAPDLSVRVDLGTGTPDYRLGVASPAGSNSFTVDYGEGALAISDFKASALIADFRMVLRDLDDFGANDDVLLFTNGGNAQKFFDGLIYVVRGSNPANVMRFRLQEHVE